MLDYSKTILQKVSFDRRLFVKELLKALQYLVPEEVRSLKSWCYQKFGSTYQMELNKCFNKEEALSLAI